MKKIYFFALMACMVMMGQLMGNKVQAQTVQIGTGTEITPSTLYSPLYRFSGTSNTTGARSNIVFTAAEMASAGIPSGSLITTIAFNKTNASQFSTGVPYTIYMANTANTTIATTTTWASILASHTSVFTNASYNVPLAAGWVSISITPFLYTGGSLEIATEYTLGAATSTANIAWEYSLNTTDKVVGVASATGTTLNGAVSTYKHRPNIRITYTAPPCSAPPVAGNAASTSVGSICTGTAVTLFLTGNSNGDGQSFIWQSSPDMSGPYTDISISQATPSYLFNPTASAYYRAAVTCSGQTVFSAPILVTVNPALAGGTYTINSAVATGGSNFQSFGAALAALNCGIAGPIVFDVNAASGPYTEQISIPAITGASSINTITFNGNGRTLQFTPVTGARHIFKLDGADYVTINNLNIVSLSADFGWGVHLTNAANNNSVTNCTINLNATTSITQSNSAGIVASNSSTVVTTTGDNANNTLISGNNIIGAYQGIILRGASATPAQNNIISNNTISDFYANGTDITYQSGLQINGNDIHRANRTTVTTFTGIELGVGCEGALVNANRIHDTHNASAPQTGTAYGIYFTGADAPTGNENRVTNNLIYNFNSGSGLIYAIFNSSSDSVLYYHNTVVLDNAASTAGTTRAFYQLTTATGIELKNNLFTVTRGGTGSKHVLYFGAPASTIASDNNNLYINTQTDHSIGFTASTSYTTLADWQAIGTYDAASTEVAPTFASPGSGNYTPTLSTLDDTGADVGVLTDILGSARNTGAPDVGAYEFTISGCTAPPTPGTASASPGGILCSGTEVAFTVINNSVGLGQTYQWESASAIGGPYTAISGVLTDPAFNYTVTNSAFYRLAVVCSGQTVYTNVINIVVPTLFPAGTYTINSALPTGGSNFQTFADALSAINCGVTGAITFNVDPASGPYNEQLTIPQILGANASNRIVFNGNGRTISFLSTVTTDRAGIKLNGADFVTIDNFVINATGTTTDQYGFGIQVLGDADNNIISNNTININISSTSTNYAGIAIGGSAISATALGGNADNNVVSGNTITGGNYSITLVGATNALIQNNQIINNIIRDQDEDGIYVSNTNNSLIERNDISRPTRTVTSEFTGIYFTSASTNARVSKNRIHDPYQSNIAATSAANGIYFTACDATAGNENIVSNNVIYNFNGGGIQYGIYNSGSDSVWFHHNTIDLNDAAYTGTSVTRGFYQITTARGITFRNNIVRISRGGAGIKYLLYFGATGTASTIVSNYNDLYIASTAGTNNIGYLALPTPATGYATLTEWQAASSNDVNSVTIEPLFLDAAAGNLAPREIALDNLGTPLNIFTDILDVVRSVTTPDMGAYEYVGSILPVKLSAFFATKVKNDVELGWSTATEINSSRFEIERSVDGNLFTKAGTVLSNNNINGAVYGFTDFNAALLPNNGTLYYRLKMIDIDGSFSYSPIAIVKLGNQQTVAVEALRNPFAGAATLKLYVDKVQSVKMSIADLQGKVFMTQSSTYAAGVHLITIKNSEQLAAGMYIAIVEIDGVRHAVRLVKQ